MAKDKQVKAKVAAKQPTTGNNTTAKSSNFDFSKLIFWGQMLLILIGFIVVYNYIYDAKPDMNGDNFAYILLGRNIADGMGFVNATEVAHRPHTHFPPGYPYLLALIIKVFGDDLAYYKIANGLFFLASVYLIYFIVKKISKSTALAFLVAIFTLLNSVFLRFSTIEMSEIPFLFITLLALYFFLISYEKDNFLKSKSFWGMVVLLGISYYFKMLGVALIAGVLGLYFFDRKWKQLIVATIAVVVLVLPWQIRTSKVGGSSHFTQLMQINPYEPERGNLTFPTLMERIKKNATRYISSDIPAGLFNMENTNENREEVPTSMWVIGLLSIVLAGVGIYGLQNFRMFFLIYFAALFTILLLWPEIWSGIRFISAILPLVLFLAAYGLFFIIDKLLKKDTIQYAPYFLLIFAFMFIAPIDKLHEMTETNFPPSYTNLFDMAKWCKDNTPKDAVFSCRKPDMFMFYANRVCVGDKPSLDDKEVMDFFRKNDVDYVVIEQLGFASTAKYLVPAVQKNMQRFETTLQLPNPDTYLLHFKEGNK